MNITQSWTDNRFLFPYSSINSSSSFFSNAIFLCTTLTWIIEKKHHIPEQLTSAGQLDTPTSPILQDIEHLKPSEVSQFKRLKQCKGVAEISERLKAHCYLSCRLRDSSQTDAISRRGTQQNGRKFLLGLLPSEKEILFKCGYRAAAVVLKKQNNYCGIVM